MPGKFIEVYVNALIEICEHCDPKGLTPTRIKEFTGISATNRPRRRK